MLTLSVISMSKETKVLYIILLILKILSFKGARNLVYLFIQNGD